MVPEPVTKAMAALSTKVAKTRLSLPFTRRLIGSAMLSITPESLRAVPMVKAKNTISALRIMLTIPPRLHMESTIASPL